MRKQNDFKWDDKPSNLQYIGMVLIILLLVCGILVLGYYIFFGKAASEDGNTKINSEGTSSIETEAMVESSEMETIMQLPDDESASGDPQSGENLDVSEIGAEADFSQILIAEGVAETEELTIGIDVSKYQGNIDWKQVAESGIDFAMIRVGYRSMESGTIVEDSSARYNLQEANAYGIKTGAYFFSTAITEQEAREEAVWTTDFISPYKITYPVAYNCEGYENEKSRQFSLTKEARTAIADAFLNEIYDNGYTPMFYASKGELEQDAEWTVSELEKRYKVWISWYPSKPYPDTADAGYSGQHAMWQYTNNGTINGIDYPVDVNVAYFGYEGENAAQNQNAPERVEANIEAGHHFAEVNETVTAKEATNLRNIPSQGDDSTVMHTLQNGQVATRTGISTSGWSRVIYDGETYYAVSSLLTTDLTAKPQQTTQTTPPQPSVQEPDDGIKTEFAPCNDNISAKIEVNLRNIPSVTDGNVVATLKYGEVIKRTGFNEDHGWSRVEYNGQTLYCVSSYIYVVAEEEETE